MRKGPARLSIHNLEGLVAEDDVDTVLVAFTDMQGRLQGKRFDARHFLSEIVGTPPRRVPTCSPSTWT